MNYRHAYHAGNFADVLKHVVLVAALDRLTQKPAPLLYLDTHAGRARYPIAAIETQRAGEYRQGIARLLEAAEAPPAVARYLALVRALGVEDGKLKAYPGSPALALAALRAGDRAALCELEPGEAAALRSELRREPRAQVHERDGFEALGALLPPPERRALVLIDPPYESPQEFERLADAVVEAQRRFATGAYAVWYPIKAGGGDTRFLQRLAASGVRRQLVVELTVERDDSPGGLNGAGMLLVNPPWQLDVELGAALPWLQQRLAGHGRGRCRASWLVPE